MRTLYYKTTDMLIIHLWTCRVSPPADEPQWQQHGYAPVICCFFSRSLSLTRTHTHNCTFMHIQTCALAQNHSSNTWNLIFIFVVHWGCNAPCQVQLQATLYWTFIIHAFVLHTCLAHRNRQRRVRSAKINNSDKSCLIRGEEVQRGEEEGWVTYDWSPAPEICMAFPAARGEERRGVNLGLSLRLG